MLRYVLMGGARGPVPPLFFLVLGGSLLAAAGTVVLLSLGSPFAWVGGIEGGVLGLAGLVLLGWGLWRRRRARGA